MFRSIRWRIALPFVILILAIMTGLGIYLSVFIRQTYLNNLEAQLTVETRLVSQDTALYLGTARLPADLDEVARRWAAALGARVTIIAVDGKVVGESHESRGQMDNHLTRPEVQAAFRSGQGSSIRLSRTVGYEMMYVAVPIEVNGKLVGAARVALPITQIEANIAHLRGTTLLATLIAGGLAILLSAVIAERTTRPLRQLTQAAQSISNGEPHKIHIQVPKDEVGQLVQAFNSMALQLRSQIEALKKESGKLGGVLNQMTDGVVIVDFQGAVQLLNPAAERMFNVREEASLGCSIAAALRHHQIVEVWRHCRETGETQVVALDLSHPRMALQCVATPLGQALPGSSLVLFQDLTRLRQLESVRRDFISNVSHELRTPLASLKALTETLQESALDDPPAARRFLQRMETEVDALSLMVSELLELSRIESGKVPLHFKSILPVNILQAAIERLKLQAERAGLAVNLDCAGNLPRVLADATRIEQVVVNLLHNAIKFTPQGGHIHLAAAQEDEAIIFSVQDSGVGIAPDDLPRIFERFYKADRARSGGGTGLGLAIARHLVEAHGGRIWAESTPGQGSTFYFSLPVAP